MGDYGLKISKDARDISEAERYMIMHSKYPVLKLAMKGTGTITKPNGSDSVTVEIAHNLGYKPLVFVDGHWYNGTDIVTKYVRWSRYLYRGVQTADFYYYYADNTKLYIKLDMSNLSNGDEIALPYMYHIFYDEDTVA